MLVLARRPDETIVFPNVGITVRVMRIKGQVARIGIDAPDDVSILRGEISPVDVSKDQPRASRPQSRDWVHEVRNRLNMALLSIELIQRLIEADRQDEIADRFDDLITELQSLDELIDVDESASNDDSEIVPGETVPNNVKILVVDDQENERTLLAGLLEMQGCEVDTVGDGVEAMEYLDTHERPDFVLLDMSMPRCSGPEFMEALRSRQEYSDLRVFAVSGNTSRSTGVPVGPGGVDGWFRKPLNTKSLLSSLSQVTEPGSC